MHNLPFLLNKGFPIEKLIGRIQTSNLILKHFKDVLISAKFG